MVIIDRPCCRGLLLGEDELGAVVARCLLDDPPRFGGRRVDPRLSELALGALAELRPGERGQAALPLAVACSRSSAASASVIASS